MTSITSAPPVSTSASPVSAETSKAREPMIWVNGKMLPKSQAAVSVFDHGLLYGDGIFEGIRIYNGKIFKLGQHMDRLYQCADKIFLDIGVSREEMIDIQRKCVETNGIKNGYIRLVVTRGEGSLGLNPYQCPKAGVICIADTISLFPPEMYEAGMRVALANRPKTPIACLDPRVKTLNYLNNIMAKCEAIHLSNKLGITDPKDKLLEVIMLSTDGQVSEGSGDNIFIIKDGVVYTPPSDVGILEGITRRFVKDELCPMLNIPVEEKLFGIEDVNNADEV
ncbi:MAG: aminotransferase class IV, partial [Phycisphaerales bacterium]|nr:aminotransferase class IV [Phycisphaerales bacterium]